LEDLIIIFDNAKGHTSDAYFTPLNPNFI
jgi:hypothetical protein